MLTDTPAIEIGAGALFALIGVIWAQLNNRMNKLEAGKVDSDHCALKEQLSVSKFDAIETRFDDMKELNSRDHEKIENALGRQAEMLIEIKDCINNLSNNKEC